MGAELSKSKLQRRILQIVDNFTIGYIPIQQPTSIILTESITESIVQELPFCNQTNMPCYVICFLKNIPTSDYYLRMLDSFGNLLKNDFRLTTINSYSRSQAKIITFPTCTTIVGSLCFSVVYYE